MNALSIDIGGTSTKCSIFIKGIIKVKYSVFTNKSPDTLIERISEQTNIELKKINIKQEDLDFMSVAVCGIVSKDSNKILMAPNLGWIDYPIKEEIKKYFNFKNIFIINDAKSATYGEWSVSYNKEINSMMLFTIGTGIGGGIIINKQIIMGDKNGFASEPGHGASIGGDRICGCGLMGCVETQSSATGITRELNQRALISTGELNNVYIKNNKSITIKNIKNLFIKEDKEVIEVFKKQLEPLAKEICLLAHILDIELFVIGGGVSHLGEKLLDIIKELVNKNLLNNFKNNVEIVLAKLSNDAGIIGAYEFGKQFLSQK